ncbi:MAG: lysoplasmalogenase [Bacilli bacterium]|nr:lysoplasmalogenase [Bacilli bacterium]
MNTVVIALLVIFGLISIAQLMFAFVENEPLRKITKPLCVLTLAIATTIAIPTYPLVYAGLYLGFVGDIILLNNKNRKMFVLGAAVFISGHILYFIQIIKLLPFAIPFWAYIIIGGILLVTTLVSYPLGKKMFSKCSMVGGFYFPLLIMMIVFGVILTINYVPQWKASFMIVGYVMFLISDLLLSYVTFLNDIKRRDFYVMLTYLIAEFCIAFSFILIL